MSAYDVFEPEFDRMSEQEKLEVGLAGIAAMHERGGFVATANPNKSRRSSSDDMGSLGLGGRGKQELTIETVNRNINTDISSFDDDASNSLVDRMRRETYQVRVTNILTDLLEPLGYKLEDLMLRSQMFETRMHNEHFLYYRSLIGEVRNLGTTNRDNFFEGLILQYRNFMRHPVWNSLRILADRVLRPLANMVTGVLFGFKKQMSDTDRIVQAIEKQTEFQRTGRIEADGNMFTRLFRTGIVNSAIRSAIDIGSYGNVGINAAQQAREKKARGEDVTITDKLAMRWFGQYADFFDTKQNDDNSISSLVDINTRTNDILISKFDEMISVLGNTQAKQTSAYQDQLSIEEMQTFMLMNAIMEAKDKQLESAYYVIGALTSLQDIERSVLDGNNQRLEEEKDHRERIMRDERDVTEERHEEQLGIFSKMVNWIKDTVDELEKHNAREKRRSFFSIIGGAVKSILPLLSLGGLGIGAGVLAWSALPDGVRDGIKGAVGDGLVWGFDELKSRMDWTHWGTLIGAGLALTPLGMKVRLIGFGAVALTSLVRAFGNSGEEHKGFLGTNDIRESVNQAVEDAKISRLIPRDSDLMQQNSNVHALQQSIDDMKERRLGIPPHRRREIMEMESNIESMERTLRELKAQIKDSTSVISFDSLKAARIIARSIPTLGISGGVSAEAINSAKLVNQDKGSLFESLYNNMIQRESNGEQFDKSGKTKTSPKGAKGIAQVIPATGRGVAGRHDIEWDANRFNTDAEYNGMLGRLYLKEQIDKYGDPVLAAMAYNAGPGAVDKFLREVGDPRTGNMSHDEFLNRVSSRYASNEDHSWAQETVPYARRVGLPLVNQQDKSFVDKTIEGGKKLGRGLVDFAFPKAEASADTPTGPAFNQRRPSDYMRETPNTSSRPTPIETKPKTVSRDRNYWMDNSSSTQTFKPTVEEPKNDSIVPSRPDAGGQPPSANTASDEETKEILKRGFNSMSSGFNSLAQSIYEVIGESGLDSNTRSLINGDN